MANSVRLGDVVDIVTGFPFKSERFTDQTADPRLLRGDNIGQGTLRWDGARHWPDGDVPDDSPYWLAKDDVILAMDRPWIEAGLKFASVRDSDMPSLLVQRVARLRGTKDLDVRYLRYVIASKAFTDHVLAVQTGTTVPHISRAQIESFNFDLPPLPEQRAIASILGSLDDKIELNRKMSATLEAIARALFNERFGVVASGATGLPAEWSHRGLGSVLATMECGSRPRGGVAQYTSGIPSIGAQSVVGIGVYDYQKTKFVPLDFFQSMRRGICQPGDVLLYKDGGKPGEYEPHATLIGEGFPFHECCINEHVYRLRVQPPLTQTYLYLCLTSELTMQELRQKGTGVAVPGLNSTALSSVSILVPDDETLQDFERQVSPMFRAILIRSAESRTLASLRDALLQKLISGELRVNDAERILEKSA